MRTSDKFAIGQEVRVIVKAWDLLGEVGCVTGVNPDDPVSTCVSVKFSSDPLPYPFSEHELEAV